MLTNTLNTNEVKDRAGTEVEFTRLSTDKRATEFAQITETPSLPHRLVISHAETGTGSKRVRRSLVRVDKTILGTDGTPVTSSAYSVVVIPIGNLSAYDVSKDALAELMSFCSTTGAATTVLFDCTGNGASALINGSL